MLNNEYIVEGKSEILSILQREHGGKVNKFYMAQDCIEGQTLEDYVKSKGTLETDEIYHIASDICDIVSYLEILKPPVIYKELRPSDIIMTSDGKVILIDVHNPKKDNNDIYAYLKGSGCGVGQANIYDIGNIMYFMATGKMPLIGFEPLIDENYGSDVESNLKRIIQKCFQVNIKNRYVSVEELSKEIIIELLKKNKFEGISDAEGLSINSDIPIINKRTRKFLRPAWRVNVIGIFTVMVGVIVAIFTMLI